MISMVIKIPVKLVVQQSKDIQKEIVVKVIIEDFVGVEQHFKYTNFCLNFLVRLS